MVDMLDRRKRALPGQYSVKRNSNRRAFPRWTAEFAVRYGKGKEMHQGEPIEIGEGGLSFAGDPILPTETEVNIEYRLLGEKDSGWIKVKGIVRHSTDKSMGVEFLNLRINDRLKIVDHITAKK
jgi:hypothetical protein